MEHYRRNELPETVKRYKTYTDSFQDWLLKTAANRNVEYAAQVAEQAKKKKKGKKIHKMSVEQQERLVEAIAESKQPLTDVSGMRDLDDALRLRKEVFQYHKVNKTADPGHAFFNIALEGAKAKFAALIAFIPVALKSHDLADEISTHIFDHFRGSDPDQSDEDGDAEASVDVQGSGLTGRPEKVTHPAPNEGMNETTLTAEEKRLQQRFLILCFLYLLNRIRGVIREVWLLFRDASINAMTAALVTDLAMSHVQQSVSALVEELNEIDGDASPLPEMVKELYRAIKLQATSPPLDDQAIHHLFCVEAIDHIKVYLASRRTGRARVSSATDAAHPSMALLRFYDTIVRDRIQLPLWDKFTEDILRNSDASTLWLPFGFQILLDVQDIVRGDKHKLYRDVTEHGIDVARLMRAHVDYEDRMWAIGKKPDYMAQGFTKFSNVFIAPLDSLLDWLQVLVKTEDGARASDRMTIDVFVSAQATMAGLAMSYFGTLYQSISISKVQWFLTSLCHLYNAARQVGGLELAWPDLDFITQMHGPKRIYVGDPPTDPYDFHSRHLLAMCVSSRFMASDHKGTGRTAPMAPKLLHQKHGLAPQFPLEEKIRAYYRTDRDNNRWLKRHNIFNHLHQLEQTIKHSDELDVEEENAELRQLLATFASMVTKIAPARRQAAQKPRVRVPQISELDDAHTPLLLRMRSELQSHELHSNFDYLSLYRRGFELTLRIRGEVLFDNAMQIARRGNIAKNQDPDCFNLIVELFSGLKLDSKAEGVEAQGDEVSTAVVPLDQLKRIAEIMEEVIRNEGSVELDRAKLRLQCDWDGLKASYAAEETGPRHEDVDVEIVHNELDERPALESNSRTDQDDPVNVREHGCRESMSKPLPPGSWPEEDDIALDDTNQKQDQSVSSSPGLVRPRPPDLNVTDVTKDAEGTEHSTTGASSVFDDFLDGFDSQLGSDSELEMHAHEFSDAESTEVHVKGLTVTASAKSNHCAKKRYQAYVLDEVDEITNSHGVFHVSRNSTVRAVFDDATISRDSGEGSSDDENDAIPILVPGYMSKSNQHVTADVSLTKVDKHGDEALRTEGDHNEAIPRNESDLNILSTDTPDYDGFRPGEPTRTSPFPVLETDVDTKGSLRRDSVSKPKHISNSHGMFHRLTFSRTVSRKHLVTFMRTSPTTASLVLARRRWGLPHRLAGLPRKHIISMRCYALCALARNLLGKESRFQRQVRAAARIIKDDKSGTPYDLQKAWGLASMVNGEQKEWESDVSVE